MLEFLSLLAVTAALLVFGYLLRQYATIAWASIVAIPILLTAYWVQTFTLYWVQAPNADLFFWIKFYTVLLGAAWIIAVRFSPLRQHRWALVTVFFFGVLNILEAVVKDLLVGCLPNYLNAAAGLVLVATAAYGYDRFTVDTDPNQDLRWDPFRGRMTSAWVMCYTTWNWVFVYLNYPELAGLDTAALLAPLLGACGDRAQYAQGRVYSLAGALLLLFTFPWFFAEGMNTVAWSTPHGRELGAAVAFLLNSSFAAWFVWRHMLLGRGEGHASAGITESDFRKQVEIQTPLGRIGKPRDTACRRSVSRVRRRLLDHRRDAPHLQRPALDSLTQPGPRVDVGLPRSVWRLCRMRGGRTGTLLSRPAHAILDSDRLR